jgi:arylsulfatase A-like enzyme
LLLAAGVAVPAGAGSDDATSAALPPGRPNIVLLTLDTTRADHLGSAGWEFASTPNLDALARRGVRFEHCDSAAPITLPAHATILSGLVPPRHGVRDNGTFVLAASVPTLAERLAAEGYDTAAVVSAVVLARRHGLDQGFRIYDDDLASGVSAGTAVEERQAEATTSAALAALAGLRPPYFLWVHYYDPHEEYRPPTRFADAARGPHGLYDGEIAYMDSEIGRLLAALPPATVVAAVGDHGEMLGEHGELTHGVLPFAGARRVPLLVAGPGVPAAQVSHCLARTVDLVPTLLALAGLPIPAGLDGEMLFPGPGAGREIGAADAACDRVSYSESFLPYYAYKWYPLRTLSDGRALYLQAPSPSLFQLDTDPGEKRDLAAEQPELARLWGSRLERLLAAAGERLGEARSPQSTLDEEQRRQLASLGYLSGAGAGGGEVALDLPDPRDRVEIAQALHAAAARIQQGGCQEVLRELERIVREDPHNFPALALAGQCLRDAGRHSDALALYRRAAQENPASAVPVANVAGSLLKLGKRDEAEREFRHALALDPTRATRRRTWRGFCRRAGGPQRRWRSSTGPSPPAEPRSNSSSSAARCARRRAGWRRRSPISARRRAAPPPTRGRSRMPPAPSISSAGCAKRRRATKPWRAWCPAARMSGRRWWRSTSSSAPAPTPSAARARPCGWRAIRPSARDSRSCSPASPPLPDSG